MNGLNDEPGWRHACVTWLNLLRLKSNPPTSARTAPVSGSSETNAASTSGSCATCQAFLSSRCTRMIAPRVIRFCATVFGSRARATNFRASPRKVTNSPVRNATLNALGLASSTTAARMSSTSGYSESASS
jgi:hypothetical protein